MAQIFHRSFNVVSKVTIFGAVFFIVALGYVLARTARSPFVTDVDVAVVQPVQFSHEHHVGKLGIDCRYCHTSVESSKFAGLPPTKTCMNCHSQIWVGAPELAPVRESYRTGKPIEWNRVHNLADFACFDHSIHLSKGIGCASCHGRVDRMPLMWKTQSLHMEWCLDCHRAPEKYVRPKDEVFNMAWEPPSDADGMAALCKRLELPAAKDTRELGERLVDKYQIRKFTNCSTCHF